MHRLRARADAVVVGAGTALADDPGADRPADEAIRGRQPLRVLVDGRGGCRHRTRSSTGRAPVLVATSTGLRPRRGRRVGRAGAEVAVFDGPSGEVSLARLIEALGKRDVQAVLIEGGPTLAWSAFVEAVWSTGWCCIWRQS